MEGGKKPGGLIGKTIQRLFSGGRKEAGKEEAPADEWGSHKPLLAHPRLIAHVSTDKPYYRPGETLYLRALLVGALDGAPLSGEKPRYIQYKLQVLSPKGDSVHTGFIDQPADSVLHGSWEVPEGQAGGEYTLRLTWDRTVNPPAERKFQVRSFRNPKLRVKIDFVGSGYGPGDQVLANISVTRSEGGGKPAGAKVTTTARVDGALVHGPQSAELDSDGLCQVTFKLPEEITEGMGSLTAVVEDGGVVESGSKTLPLVLRSLNVKFFPEGGPLVAGVESRIYFEALTPTEEPIELQGEIWAYSESKEPSLVTSVSAKHEGRGRFALNAKAGEKYELRVTKPRGVTKPIPLPEPETHGPNQRPLVAITTPQDSYNLKDATSKELRVNVASAEAAKVRVAVFKREEELSSISVELPGGGQPLAVSLPLKSEHIASRCGVLRVTVFSEDGVPLSERLMFVEPPETLQVEVTCPTEDSAVPGADQVVEIRVRDANGKLVKGAVVGVCVTDVSTLDMVEDRRKAPRLPAMVYLEGEVQHLEDSSAYLQSTEAGALALDLLLGTQGWRRFAYRTPVEKLLPTGEGSASADPFARFMGLQLKDVNVAHPADIPLDGVMFMRAAGGPPGRGFRKMAAMPIYAPMAASAAPAPMRLRSPMPAMAAPSDSSPDSDSGLNVYMKGGSVPEADDEDLAEGGGGLPEPPAPPPPAPKLAKQEDAVPLAMQVEVVDLDRRKAKKKMLARPITAVDAVRIYAHRKSADAGALRTDFTETVYWNAAVVTSADGVARAEFALSDSVTSFAVIADAHAARGTDRCGAFGTSDSFRLSSRRPIYADAKVPLELTAGDNVKLPIVVINSTGDQMDATVSVDLEEPLSTAPSDGPITLKVPERKRVRHMLPVSVQPPKSKGKKDNGTDDDERHAVSSASVTINLKATAGPGLSSGATLHTDMVKRTVDIAPRGFPMDASFGGMLKPGADPTACIVRLPPSVAEGSLSVSINIYATPVGSLTQALEALLTEPYGCFEQASSTVYPNIMAQLYFKTHTGVDPKMVKRSYELLEKGFEKLKGYEVDGSGGYEWFGSSPAHEALTAYGLLEFTDMAKVFPVPQEMLTRTRTWLLKRKDDGNGGFQLNSRQLDSFGGAPANITNAYIVWSLTYAGLTKGLEKQVESLEKQAESNKDAYFRGLVAGTLYNVGRLEPAEALARGLLKFQQEDGSVTDAKTSITRSGGESLVIETSSIAILVWLNNLGTFGGAARKAVEWLSTRCKNGKFGSTQGTILALKAIVAYDQAHSHPLVPGTAHVFINGECIQSLKFDGSTKGTISFDGPALATRLAANGDYKFELKMDNGSEMPFSAQVQYHAEIPPSGKGCDVSLSVALPDSTVKEGEIADVAVTVQNLTDKPLPMTVAIVGFPGGLEPRHDQIKELVTQGIIAFYEVNGREVVLYWRTIAANASISLRIEATAAVPGDYMGPASRAYLYYTDEFKAWVPPLSVSIAPQG